MYVQALLKHKNRAGQMRDIKKNKQKTLFFYRFIGVFKIVYLILRLFSKI